jgi:ubiquinone/menaquinone biosynthesis C-methylase UbiE
LAGLAFSNFVKQQRGGSSGAATAPSGMDLGRLLRSGLYVPLSEALLMFYQDYENVRRGIYKLPWDMTTSGHRQTNPLNVLDKFTRFMREASSTLGRRDAGVPDKVWLESGLYPSYYLNSWHYQTDGWLSEESAKVYEASTETVFVGRQDAMQRQNLVPMRSFMQRKNSVDGAGLKLLEVACGTGRFATFVKDNYPRLAVTQLDLSPFYLQEARNNMDYWRSRRGGPRPEDTVASQDRFLHAPAENIPAPDASFDVVSTIYLFHELPDDARKAAVAEMARVLKPGGLLVFNDGTQLGDRPINDATQGNFQAFNEPNWGTHIALDYGKLFSDAGLVPDMKVLASGSKVLSFSKPLTDAN